MCWRARRMVGWIRQPSPAEKEFLAAEIARVPETGRLTGRGDTVSLEAPARGQARPRARLRVDHRQPNLAGGPGAEPDRHSLRADRWPLCEYRQRPTVSLPPGWRAGSSAARRSRPMPTRRLRQSDEVIARVPAEKRPRVYLARGPEGWRPALARLDQHREARGARRAQRRRAGGRGGIATVSLEQVLAWEPGSDPHHRPGFLRVGVRRARGGRCVAAVRQGACTCRRNLPLGWIDFPPCAQPPDRAAGGRAKLLYPRNCSPATCAPNTREFYRLLLPLRAERGAARRTARRAGLMLRTGAGLILASRSSSSSAPC